MIRQEKIKIGVLIFITLFLICGFCAVSFADPCEADAKKYCSNVSPGSGPAMECLKDHYQDVSQECYDVLAQRKQQTTQEQGGSMEDMRPDEVQNPGMDQGSNMRQGSSIGQDFGMEQGPGMRRPRGLPPREAVEACLGHQEGDVVEFNAPHGMVRGTCRMIQGQLACVPAGGPPGRSRQSEEERPPDERLEED